MADPTPPLTEHDMQYVVKRTLHSLKISVPHETYLGEGIRIRRRYEALLKREDLPELIRKAVTDSRAQLPGFIAAAGAGEDSGRVLYDQVFPGRDERRDRRYEKLSDGEGQAAKDMMLSLRRSLRKYGEPIVNTKLSDAEVKAEAKNKYVQYISTDDLPEAIVSGLEDLAILAKTHQNKDITPKSIPGLPEKEVAALKKEMITKAPVQVMRQRDAMQDRSTGKAHEQAIEAANGQLRLQMDTVLKTHPLISEVQREMLIDRVVGELAEQATHQASEVSPGSPNLPNAPSRGRQRNAP